MEPKRRCRESSLYIFDSRPHSSPSKGKLWRKRVGVDPTIAAERRRSPVLKTGRITGPIALPVNVYAASESYQRFLLHIAAQMLFCSCPNRERLWDDGKKDAFTKPPANSMCSIGSPR